MQLPAGPQHEEGTKQTNSRYHSMEMHASGHMSTLARKSQPATPPPLPLPIHKLPQPISQTFQSQNTTTHNNPLRQTTKVQVHQASISIPYPPSGAQAPNRYRQENPPRSASNNEHRFLYQGETARYRSDVGIRPRQGYPARGSLIPFFASAWSGRADATAASCLDGSQQK